MNQHCFIKRVAAMALVLIIALGLLPTGALGAERSSAIPVDSETKLQQAIFSASDHVDTIIEITQNIYLSKTIQIPAGKKITIQSSFNNRFTIQPRGEATDALGSALFYVGHWQEGKADAIFANLTLDGGGKYRSISSFSNSLLGLYYVTVRNGRRSGASDHGAGIYMAGGTLLANDSTFEDNIAEPTTSTMGGAVALASKTRGRFFCLDAFFNM